MPRPVETAHLQQKLARNSANLKPIVDAEAAARCAMDRCLMNKPTPAVEWLQPETATYGREASAEVGWPWRREAA